MLDIEKLSYWELKSYFKDIDFLIIGAGIVGYSTAIHLRKQYPKSKILVIERGYLPSGASSKNAGFACFGSATELTEDLSKFDDSTVWETVKMRWEGLNYLRGLIGDDSLKLKVNGSWDLITSNDIELRDRTALNLNYFNKQLKDITGENDVYSIDHNTQGNFGFSGIDTSFRNRLEGQIDTASMNKAFYALTVKHDIMTLFGIEAIDIRENNVSTNLGDIAAKAIAICTNGFAKQLLPEKDIAPARAQVLITKPIIDLPFEGTFHYQMGYYYFRNIDGRVLFGGGRNLDFKGEETTEFETTALIQEKLESLLREVILPSTPFEIEHRWTGVMGVGETKKPIIQHIQDNTYCGVRLGGMGVAIGTLVGKNLAEIISA
ncbi:MAG: NAD(P)/FAD-dependent oxidoreductase [Crocinitomicaceae bacterium]